MSKQTAVEWYANASHELIVKKNNGEITNVDFLILHHNLFYEAQKMEKEQEAEIFKEAQICAVKHDGVYFKYESIEDYYKSKEVEVESSDNSKGQEYQHALTWVNALKYAIEKMKGLDNSESEDAFKKYYNETYGGQMSKMSALDFLEYRYKHNVNLTEGDFVQAKAMHKAEIEKTHFDGQCVNAKTGTTYESLIESSKKYYNQKFGGQDE